MAVLLSRDICARFYVAIVALRPDWQDDDHMKAAIKALRKASASDPKQLQTHHTREQ